MGAREVKRLQEMCQAEHEAAENMFAWLPATLISSLKKVRGTKMGVLTVAAVALVVLA